MRSVRGDAKGWGLGLSYGPNPRSVPLNDEAVAVRNAGPFCFGFTVLGRRPIPSRATFGFSPVLVNARGVTAAPRRALLRGQTKLCRKVAAGTASPIPIARRLSGADAGDRPDLLARVSEQVAWRQADNVSNGDLFR
jgi:hypothetical protein